MNAGPFVTYSIYITGAHVSSIKPCLLSTFLSSNRYFKQNSAFIYFLYLSSDPEKLVSRQEILEFTYITKTLQSLDITSLYLACLYLSLKFNDLIIIMMTPLHWAWRQVMKRLVDWQLVLVCRIAVISACEWLYVSDINILLLVYIGRIKRSVITE